MISFLNFNNIIFYLLVTAILLDIFLGSLQALKEKKWNSTVGINGIFELFGIMFILYEITSILKNMVKCGLPIPKKIKTTIEKLLNNLTSETGGEKNE